VVGENVADVSPSLQDAYNEQYTEQMTEWRELGGQYKAENILNLCKSHKFDKVLECGAGEGSILKFLDMSGQFPNLYAIEISDSGIGQIQKRQLERLREIKKFDGYHIPYENDCFDMVYCSHVMEHVEHPRILLRELKRVSKYQIFEIPLEYSPKVDRWSDDHMACGHINVYTPSLFRFLLKSEGFEILEEFPTHTTKDVLRYNWYHNLKLNRPYVKEIRLALRPFELLIKRLLWGKDCFRERAYSIYTCMTRDKGELKVL